jgi:hypothetical protein
MKVPVMDLNRQPLMPTTKHRAMKLIARKEATPFWNHGVWCIRLNREPSARNIQDMVAGIDTGSKREAIVVKTEAHTIINVQLDAITHVSDRVTTRRQMRRTRRTRKTPCRASRKNRAQNKKKRNPPSTKARWQWKLNILKFLIKLFPISDVVVEDVKATSRKNGKKWNRNFSPIECGKQWFYDQILKLGKLWIREGWQTAETRNMLGLKKNKNKMSLTWDAHCVDAWCLTYDIIGGDSVPDDTQMLYLTFIPFRRRQLHLFQPAKGGIRRSHGGTRSCGFKRGSLVRHPKYGVTYVGGTMNSRISLHSIETGNRLTQCAKPEDLKFLAYNGRRARLLPAVKDRVFAASI